MSKVFVFEEFGGPESQALIERDVPAPGPGELLVAVRAAGVNPADVKRRAGAFGRTIALPAPMGLEFAGVVEALGEGTEGFAVGDAVLGLPARGGGGFAEHTVAAATKVVAKPASLPFTDAAALPVAGATAWDGAHQVPLAPGQTLLINGVGGGVGTMAAQIARAEGIRVVGTASEAKRALVEELGATLVVSGPGVTGRLRAVLPDGADAVLDLVGGQALRDVAPLAKDPAAVVTTVDPATATELGGAGVARRPTRESLGALVALVASGAVAPRVTAVYPLDRTAEALAAVEGGHTAGKVVVEVSRASVTDRPTRRDDGGARADVV
ncbi:NADP-dependent oxidoreductase [Georgenia sp. SYP-B2076]|uniref:NADP-dependent oxidoreductase n=1 Tax=Georgenia sp. SYP-B2076 TaxID=2495881 RepID=UPI000F8CDD68|nr:NADP-dependent oxidoreductase [Georgenia sp. SYP-B2076]